jgi:hypothetical protein
MFSIPGSSLKVAQGSIVAYEDTNHNGKLDLVAANATTAIDRVLAVPTDTMIVYFEGDPGRAGADDNGVTPTAGFQFEQIQPLGEWACSGGPIIEGVNPPSSCPGYLWQPISTPLTLSLSSNPELSAYMCGSAGGSIAMGGATTPGMLSDFNGKLPAKSDPNLLCQADGKSFIYGQCTPVASKSLCDVEENCVEHSYAYDPAAKGWPCPMK